MKMRMPSPAMAVALVALVNVIIEGAIRQDGLNTGGAWCLAFGTVELVH